MIRFIILSTALICVSQAAESEINKAMKKFKIIPGIVKGNVPEVLKITFDNETSVNMGNRISPTQAKNPPQVDWDADDKSFYTLLCFDADAPSPSNPHLSPLITWMVTNIPGKRIELGQTLADYFAVAPPRRENFHRAIILLFKQPNKLEFKEKRLANDNFRGRIGYSLERFSKKYNLGEPIGCNFYVTFFDKHVMDVHRKLNCLEYDGPEE